MGKALLLASIYYGDSPGALRGPTALYEQAQKEGHLDVTLKDCVEYLNSQRVYTVYKRARRNYKRNPIVALFCGETVQIDIMVLMNWTAANDGYRYVLLSCDTYSKYLSSFPMKTRKPEDVVAGLEALVRSLPFTITNIYWDKEGSFVGRKVTAWLKAHHIGSYTTTSKVKAPGVERAIRTVRQSMQRHFDATGTRRWLEFLPRFVANYNDRVHSTTKLRPIDLANDPLLTVPHRHNRRLTQSTRLPPVGSHVRLNRLRGIFEKEATGTWTEEVFRVARHKTRQDIPMVLVEDLTGEPILGALYPEEYQVIDWPGEGKTTKTPKDVVETRTRRGGIKEVRVTFEGWPRRHTEWIPKPLLDM